MEKNEGAFVTVSSVDIKLATGAINLAPSEKKTSVEAADFLRNVLKEAQEKGGKIHAFTFEKEGGDPMPTELADLIKEFGFASS